MNAPVPAAPRLVDRAPQVPAEHLIAGFTPPPQFSAARFATYRPDADHPSQAAASARLQQLAGELTSAGGARRSRWLGRRRATAPAVYLDGGFGVGKTHLLAALAHEASGHGRAVYGTFVEYTHLVGALGFAATVRELSRARLVCIDEFELDDPGDTVLMSRLLRELGDAGVVLAATSNTLPESLGEGRFAAQDFLREIQAIASRFEVLRIGGPDYRHRGAPQPRPGLPDDDVRSGVAALPGATCDDFGALLAHLRKVHPSRYGALLDDVTAVGLTGSRPLDDQADALRLVVLVDRLYDRGIPVLLGGSGTEGLFAPAMLRGGYRKKYLRTLSRLTSLTRDPAAPGDQAARRAHAAQRRGVSPQAT